VRRATRTALVLPVVFALGKYVVGDEVVALFAAFGSFSMLLLVDFGGSRRDRIEAHLALWAGGAGLICLGTLASRSTVTAVAAMFVLSFGVLFSGVVSSVLAGSSTSLLLALMLGLTLPGTASAIPDRLAGWSIAAGAALLAVTLLWPAPAQDQLRDPAVTACRALALRLRAAAQGPAYERRSAEASVAVAALRKAFLATPYRPSGLGTAARALVGLVDQINWIETVVTGPHPTGAAPEATKAVKEAAATVLDLGADLLEQPRLATAPLNCALAELLKAREALEHDATIELPVSHAAGTFARGSGQDEALEFVTSLDPAFRSQELGFVIASIARDIERAAAAEDRSWWQRALGRQPAGASGPVASARDRAAAYLEPHSVWLHNSLRGAAGLAGAVLVAELTGVEHAFWVVFGTLSVLRSNALSTGQNVMKAMAGTVLGLAVSAGLLTVAGTHTAVLWVLLPVVVLCAGITPALISFTVGQAAFTATMLIIFNLVQPAGWRLGAVRLEDVALGCAVSLGVGLLLWPRGASATLRKALAEAYTESARYLDAAVAVGAVRCDAAIARPVLAPAGQASRAAAAARRLDDTFRTYLAEQGAKPVPLAEMTALVTGVAALRLSADAVLDLWECDQAAEGDRSAARTQLQSRSAQVAAWYDELAAGFTGPRPIPAPLGRDDRADGHLIESVRRDLRSQDGTATATAVRMIWTADHLDAARRLQARLSAPALALRQGGRPLGDDD
jgi:uncharacterized membrane protein YccC